MNEHPRLPGLLFAVISYWMIAFCWLASALAFRTPARPQSASWIGLSVGTGGLLPSLLVFLAFSRPAGEQISEAMTVHEVTPAIDLNNCC